MLRIVRAAAVLAALASMPACGHTKKESSMISVSPSSGAEVVRAFFAAFGSGDLDAVVGAFHPSAEITAVRRSPRGEGELYGSYAGHEGVRDFVRTLGQLFATQAFSVDGVIGEGNVAFASGSFVHEVKSTGKLFRSDWALRCDLEDGKIRRYRFFEDSAAFADASR